MAMTIYSRPMYRTLITDRSNHQRLGQSGQISRDEVSHQVSGREFESRQRALSISVERTSRVCLVACSLACDVHPQDRS
jgi:hypothetical protein